jgi:DNA-binding IclR family transcriptional regulator
VRLLASLSHGGLLRKTPEGLWALGPEISRLASLYTASFSLEDVVLPVIKALVNKTGESVALHVKQGHQRLCLYRVDSPQLLRDHVRAGDVLPLDRGAGGRVLMAFTGAKGKIYDKIRKDGYIMVAGDRVPGLVGVSAPVCKGHGELVGALTLTVPESRFKAQFVGDLRRAAASLCEKLG